MLLARNGLPLHHTFQCMLERTDAVTKEVLELITFVVAYPTVCVCVCVCVCVYIYIYIYIYWTPMILKLRIFRFHKTCIWFIHSTTRRSTNKHIPTARYRQPSCTTNKFTNSNNRNSSRCITLMNGTKTWSKNRCHTRPTKPSEILN